MFSECLLVILNLLPFCWLSIILLSSITFPLIPTQDMAEEGGILQPALAHSQYHYGEQCCFHPPPCWDCLACCRGHSRDSSPSPGWEGTEVIPCQLGLDQGENSWECGCCMLQSPLRTCPRKAGSFSQWSWPLEGCKSNLNRVPEADNVVFVYSKFPGLSTQTIKVCAQ